MLYFFRKRSLPSRCNKGGKTFAGCFVAAEALAVEKTTKNEVSAPSALTPRPGYSLALQAD